MNRGFTLVELLGVLIVLALILSIVIVSVKGVINTSKKKLSNVQISTIEEAANHYYIREGQLLNSTCISVNDLIDKGYLDGDEIKDPTTSNEITGYVKISNISNQYVFKYQEESCE